MTLIDGIRRAAVGIGGVALVATAASAVQADDLHRPPAEGFASSNGTEVGMLTGPTCTWDAPEDDRYRRYDRENEVCNSEDKRWWAAAPVISGAGPTSDVVFRWATDAQPLGLDTYGYGARSDLFPGSASVVAIWGCADTTNPCSIKRADVSTGGVTYVVEAHWSETSSTKYAVTFK